MHEQPSVLYDLVGVVRHRGRSMQAGHYVAHVREPRDSSWWLCDDAHVTPSTAQTALNTGDCDDSPVLLFYVKQ